MHFRFLLLPPAYVATALAAMPVAATNYLALAEAQQLIFPGAEFTPADLTLTDEQAEQLGRVSGTTVYRNTVKVWKVSTGGWFFLDQVPGRDDRITYALGLNPDGSIKAVEVLVCVVRVRPGARRLAAHFAGRRFSRIHLGGEVPNISGSTLSVAHMADGVTRLLATHALFIAPGRVERARPLLGNAGGDRLPWPGRGAAHRGIDAAFAAIAEVHRLMSFHAPDSDVTRLNQARRGGAGRGRSAHRGRARARAGAGGRQRRRLRHHHRRATRGLGKVAAPAGRAGAGHGGDLARHRAAPDGRVRFHRPLWIDLGGIAKGFAVDRAIERVAGEPPVRWVVNAGGDLRVAGRGAEPVLLQTDQPSAAGVAVVELEDASLASSRNPAADRGAPESLRRLAPRRQQPSAGRARRLRVGRGAGLRRRRRLDQGRARAAERPHAGAATLWGDGLPARSGWRVAEAVRGGVNAIATQSRPANSRTPGPRRPVLTVGNRGAKTTVTFSSRTASAGLADARQTEGISMADQPKGRADVAVDFVKSDYDKAVITDDVHTDNLMTAMLQLAGEVWVIRRRLLIADRLAEKKVFATAAAIDAYVPSAEETAAWERERNSFIDRTLSVLTRPGKRLEGASIPSKRDAAPLRKV